MAEHSIPTQDGPAQVYMQNFADVIAANVGLYQLGAADSAAISAAAGAYSAALLLALNPPTRNELTIIAKDEARNAAEQIVRQYAMQIKFNAGIPTDAKAAIGVAQPNPTRTPINVPDTLPALLIVGSLKGSQTVQFRNPDTEGKAKPFGATMVELWVAVTEEDPALFASQAKAYGLFTKNPIGVAFAEADDGKMATHFARWVDRKGQVGPWSLPVSMRIAA